MRLWKLWRFVAISLACVVVLAACGDDPDEAAAPIASPQQAEAIGTLIDAELTESEQQCMLVGLLNTEIDAAEVIAGTVTREEDAQLLAIAASCIEDFSTVPSFVQEFIKGAAEAGTTLTEPEAICMIRNLGTAGPDDLLEMCLDGDVEPRVETPNYGDDPELDRYWDGCADGNAQFCDELYRLAPADSEYLEFARSCGGLLPDSVGYRCFDELG